MAEERGRVLVVDDEESVRQLLQRTLAGAGYNVVTAADGQEALDKMSQLNIEVVLLDIKMPGMSGIEVLKQLTAYYPDTCAVMATAVGDAQTAVETMKLGAYDYIVKPFNTEDVVLTVQRAVEKRNLWLENKRHREELQKKIGEQAKQLQELFAELVGTLAREHKLLYKLKESQAKGGKLLLSKLPPELQEPMSSVEEFRDALIRILKRS